MVGAASSTEDLPWVIFTGAPEQLANVNWSYRVEEYGSDSLWDEHMEEDVELENTIASP